MALCGVGVSLGLQGRCFDANMSAMQSTSFSTSKYHSRGAIRCLSSTSSSGKSILDPESGGGGLHIPESEFDHVTKFEMSDFAIADTVTVGLGGREDELLFEAIVKDSNSALHNTKVVLLQLTSIQAQRRGKRAIEVLKKLAKRRMIHSYSMQVHGYVSSQSDTWRIKAVRGKPKWICQKLVVALNCCNL